MTELPPETTATIVLSDPGVAMLGPGDANLRALERALPEAQLHLRGDRLTVQGAADVIEWARVALSRMTAAVAGGDRLAPELVGEYVRLARAGQGDAVKAPAANILTSRGRTVRPKTVGQRDYVDAIDANTVVFGIGPAGTGKTYLAVAKAVQALQAKTISRIILTRPAVEAGERLGFLPGTLAEKVDPYLRPLYDALHDMLDPAQIPKLLASGTIEVAPLAYMRGRTLSDSFIILDEAQNTSPEQMKMFLTRLGFGSTMVVTGDVTQVDLPRGTASGLRVVESILSGIEGIEFRRLTSADVVRHPVVGRIVDAYEHHESELEGSR